MTGIGWVYDKKQHAPAPTDNLYYGGNYFSTNFIHYCAYLDWGGIY